jgi:hypothetical protein
MCSQTLGWGKIKTNHGVTVSGTIGMVKKREIVRNILTMASQRPILWNMSKAQLSGHPDSHSQSSPLKPTQTQHVPALSEPWTCQTTFGDPPDPLAYLWKPIRPMSCPFRPSPLVRSSLLPMTDEVDSVITCVLMGQQRLMPVYISPDPMFSYFHYSGFLRS